MAVHGDIAQPRGPEDEDGPFEAQLSDPADWSSLVGDLSFEQPRTPTWRVHDRTHLEFAVHYPVGDRPVTELEWEAYFFVPESLRLDRKTYTKAQMEADLQSYVRFATPRATFSELVGAPLERLDAALSTGDRARATRELRLFACQVRATGVHVRHTIAAGLAADADGRSMALASAARLVADTERLTRRFREILSSHQPGDEELAIAVEWVDEDVSRVLETILGSIWEELCAHDAPKALRRATVKAAVEEAKYRAKAGLGGVGRSSPTKREVEHLEFRRHVLKRFTSSVLWLKPRFSDPGRWAMQLMYAVAAGVAMAFALGAALLNGFDVNADRLWLWCLAVIVAYMGKDRIKSNLQSIFAGVVSKRFPDRRWHLEARDGGGELGRMDEQSGFVPSRRIPESVLTTRRSTGRHPVEEEARPETVLWHRKGVRLKRDAIAKVDPRFDTITEIFRLDLRRWLAHTDDPKRQILFADPEAGRIRSATAPRVYNIGVVYRLRSADEPDAPWQRVRVVVTRKGIRRIDHIEPD